MAEHVTKLSSICINCSKEAFFTKRLIDCQDIELIGGGDMLFFLFLIFLLTKLIKIFILDINQFVENVFLLKILTILQSI